MDPSLRFGISEKGNIPALSRISLLFMKIALIAPPFISVPPRKYGGTELFIAELAEGLQQEGVDVGVYTNGESTVNVPKQWSYEKENLPVSGDPEANLQNLSQSSWAS